MAPEEGLEPSTHRLTADCSTIELLWNARRRRKLAVGISLRQRAFVAGCAAQMARDWGQATEGALPGERWLVGFWGLAPRDRACARRKALGRGVAFALCARGWGVRLQCSLRHGPAAARYLWGHGIFRDRLLLLVRDRLPGELLEVGTGWLRWLRGQAALGRSRCGLGWEWDYLLRLGADEALV